MQLKYTHQNKMFQNTTVEVQIASQYLTILGWKILIDMHSNKFIET